MKKLGFAFLLAIALTGSLIAQEEGPNTGENVGGWCQDQRNRCAERCEPGRWICLHMNGDSELCGDQASACYDDCFSAVWDFFCGGGRPAV